MENKPAGWYRNTGDRRQHGYWDGRAWVDAEDAPEPDGEREHELEPPPERA